MHEPGKSYVTVRVGDADRRYLLFVPAGYDASRRHSLLLIFHGAGATPDGRSKAEFEFDEIWNAPPFELPPNMIVAAPQAAGDAWDPDPYAADADLATVVLDDLEERLCVDPDRMFATGISSGGNLVSGLVCRLAGRLAAVGTTIGMLDPFDECEDAPPPMPIVSIVGDEDRTSPALGIAAAHARWARHNGCGPETQDDPGVPGVSLTRYDGCAGEATVNLYVISGMKHQQARSDCSNIPAGIRGRICFEGAFDFRRAQLDFFDAHPRP